MTAPDPTAGEHRRVGNGPDALDTCTGCDWESWDTAPSFADHPASPPAVAASTGTSEDVEALLDCECGHSLGEHNGLGCYARISYEPLVQCSCVLTDDRTHGELLAPRLTALLAAARAEALREAARELPGLDSIRTHGDAAKWLRDRADQIEAAR